MRVQSRVISSELGVQRERVQRPVGVCGGWVGEAGSEGPGKGSRESCSSSSHQSTTHDKPSRPTQKKIQKKNETRTPSGILCCSAALGGWAGEREREKDEGGKGRRRAGRAPSTRPQSMRGGRRGGRHRCPSPLIKLLRLPPVHPSHGPWRDKPDHIGMQRALYCEFRGLGRRLERMDNLLFVRGRGLSDYGQPAFQCE